MNYLYSLYDALVSISVPADKARAVVDAMERDMGTTLATKQDVSLLAGRVDMCATKQDLGMLSRDMENRFALQDQKTESMRVQLEQKIDSVGAFLEQKIEVLRGDMSRDLAALDLRMTVKLGSMLVVCFGLTIAAMRLWL
ncbi:MAG: hypothetical protein ACRES3_07225 [Steroidobacteraceae bacterium]